MSPAFTHTRSPHRHPHPHYHTFIVTSACPHFTHIHTCKVLNHETISELLVRPSLVTNTSKLSPITFQEEGTRITWQECQLPSPPFPAREDAPIPRGPWEEPGTSWVLGVELPQCVSLAP